MIGELSYMNTLMIDFDTQLTNLKRNNFVTLEYPMLNKTDTVLPYELTFPTLLDRITNHCCLNSLLVIDSLNGLIDYFGIPFYPSDNDKIKDKIGKNMSKTDNLIGNIKHAGYRGFSLLNIIFQNHLLKEIPIIITSYISKRGLDNLIAELAARDDKLIRDKNHFRRISNSVFGLGFTTNDHMLIATLIKKETKKIYEPSKYLDYFPQSIRIKINISAKF